MNLTESIIQHKRNAEKLFCSSVLIQADLARTNCGWLRPDQFTDQRYKSYWSLVQNGAEAATAAMQTQVYDDLLAGQNEIVSSMEYESFAKIIAEDDYFINIASTLPKMAKHLIARDGESLQKSITELSQGKPEAGRDIMTAYEIGVNFSEILGKEGIAIKTNILPYDQGTGGLSKCALHIIAARPSMGKTSCAWQIARNMAVQKKKVIYFSLEMDATKLWARAVCGLSGVAWKKIKENSITNAEHTRLIDKSGELMNLYGEYLMVDDRSRMTSEDIWQSVAKIKPDCIIVDHAGLMADKAENDVKRMGAIIWAGKTMAKEFDLVAIYLQQLSRGLMQRNDKRPIMTDLRDSGEIEQNADTVTFLHRDDYYEAAEETPEEWSKTEMIIAKDRDGERNIAANVYYNVRDQWFYDKREAYAKGMK